MAGLTSSMHFRESFYLLTNLPIYQWVNTIDKSANLLIDKSTNLLIDKSTNQLILNSFTTSSKGKRDLGRKCN